MTNSSYKSDDTHVYLGSSDFENMIFLYAGPSVLGFVFLIWMSSAFIWFISLLFAITICGIHFLLLRTKRGLSENAGVALNLFAVCFSAFLYFSAPFTDSASYCGKQVYTDFTPTLTLDRRGSYRVKDKMSTRWGSEGCDSGTINSVLLFISALASLWFFIKVIILCSNYYVFETRMAGIRKPREKVIKNQCRAKNKKGNRCRASAMSNGYCRVHGGSKKT